MVTIEYECETDFDLGLDCPALAKMVAEKVAGWFYRSEIPEDRTHLSLTGEMMEQFRKGLA